jgi:RNA polymerase sigma factor (sigma-70 family)
MDDREIVAAIATGDLAGLAEAYDKYAESLYGYCYMMLNEPEDAADVVQDTFVIAAARLGGLQDPRKLRPWLYAVARNECHHRLGATEADPDEVGDLDGPVDPSAEPGADDSAERAELRRLVRAALDGLNRAEREAVELSLRHDLDGADLAAVLGVSRNQAHALASRAHGQLDKALGALLVARTGRRACPELDLLLDDWDGRLTAPSRKRISHHIDQCDVCTDRKHGALRPAALYGMAPLAAPPPGLREEVLGLCGDDRPLSLSYRRDVMEQAGSFRPNGFPEPIRAPRPRLLALSGVAAVVGILIAVVATGIITVLALGGSHAPPPADAARSDHPSGSAAASVTTSSGSAGAAAPTLPPATSAPAATSVAAPVATPSASPTKAKPSPSATSSAPTSPTPTPRRPTPTPTSTTTPTPRPTATPPLPLSPSSGAAFPAYQLFRSYIWLCRPPELYARPNYG